MWLCSALRNAEGDVEDQIWLVTNVLAAAQLLIDQGADVNAVDRDGNTPLALAVKQGLSEIAALIRNHGAQQRS